MVPAWAPGLVCVTPHLRLPVSRPHGSTVFDVVALPGGFFHVPRLSLLTHFQASHSSQGRGEAQGLDGHSLQPLRIQIRHATIYISALHPCVWGSFRKTEFSKYSHGQTGYRFLYALGLLI